MKLRWFLMVLGVIALVASVFSPSTIGIATGSQGELSSSQTGLSDFVSLLHHQGYAVEIANTTQQELSFAKTTGAVFFLIDPDTTINSTFAGTLFSEYHNGSISLVLAEGNSTNEASLLSKFGATVTGAAIKDSASSFSDQRIFDVSLNLTSPTVGEIDIGSPITLNDSATLAPVAQSSPDSVDTENSTVGPRTVIAATSLKSNPSSRAILISSSSPFTNCGLSQCTNLNDTALDVSIVAWASGGNLSRPVVIDASHYVPSSPPIGFGVPVGWIMIILLKSLFSYVGSSGFGSPASGTSFSILGHSLPGGLTIAAEIVVSLILLLIISNRITAWFSPEKPVKDDKPSVPIERNLVSESRERQDFLTGSRTKSFYVVTLGQLYSVLDEVMKLEMGAGVREVTVESLAEKLGAEKGMRAHRMLTELSKYSEYANGNGRFILPPGLSWKRTVASMTAWAEVFLNDLGLTMTGKEGGRPIEYALKH